MPEEYASIQRSGTAELIIKKSRFIGRCFPAGSEAEANAYLDSVRKACWDATHNCYALRIGPTASLVRSSDDGEPSGTAGMPILNVLNRQNLVNILCVVTRYFGGILLGAGGLVRAYTDAAAAAIKNAGIVCMQSCTAYELTMPYPLYAALEKVAEGYGGFCEKAFTDTVRAVVWVRDTQQEAFLTAIRELTDARVLPKAVAHDVRAFDQ